uniref:Methyltransferase type 11 domain-containing protein n=1 Tax=Clytia hemisphaerica TaxID=252671 RepID=A0A7M5XPY0_9CNID
MSNLVISGLTTITTIQLFDGWDNISEILEDIRKIGCSLHDMLPENKFIRASFYTVGTVVLLRSIPFILRRTSFFTYYEKEMIYFHRSNNNKQILEMKEELLKELNEDADTLPKLHGEKLMILELNAGSGTNSVYYPEGSYLIATDSREDEKEKIENNFLLSDDNEDIKKLSLASYIHTIPEELAGVPDNSISCVISFHSLCNARKKQRALDEILRVLMPGGRFYFH